jgi:hypothetical protein
MHRSGNYERSEDDHSVDLKRSVGLLPSALSRPRSLELYCRMHCTKCQFLIDTSLHSYGS